MASNDHRHQTTRSTAGQGWDRAVDVALLIMGLPCSRRLGIAKLRLDAVSIQLPLKPLLNPNVSRIRTWQICKGWVKNVLTICRFRCDDTLRYDALLSYVSSTGCMV